MNKNRQKRALTTILLPIVGIVILAALMTVLAPCGPKEDGTFMSCHYAGQALRILAGASVIVSLACSMWAPGPGKLHTAADVLVMILSAAMILIPGHVIHLCMMPEMQCRAVMKPGSMVLAVLLLILAAADLVLTSRK